MRINKDSQKVPNLRFKGFTDDWEQRRLGEIGKVKSGVGFPDNEQGGKEGIPFYKVSDMNNIGNEIEMNCANNYVNESQIINRKWKVIDTTPAVIFAKVGAAIMLNRKRLVNNPFLIDNNTMAYIFNDTWGEYFGKIMFDTIYLPKYAQIGALPSYNGSDIEIISVVVPNKKEQNQIGIFFKQLDNAITLHQRKLEQLNQLKEALLQQMFPGKGETVPKLRFAGFEGDWEERKLGDILSERNDQMPETNEYPLMSFVQGKGVTPKGERYNRSFLVKDSEKKYKKTELGDFIYSSNNLETGSIGFNKTGKAVISPVYSIFNSKKAKDSQFIGILSARKEFISDMVRFRQGVVYGQWRIHESDFLNINIRIPNDKEKQLIIYLFENIDNTLVLYQRKLDQLQNMKQVLLQNMFI